MSGEGVDRGDQADDEGRAATKARTGREIVSASHFDIRLNSKLEQNSSGSWM